jgi:hypothetical protein
VCFGVGRSHADYVTYIHNVMLASLPLDSVSNVPTMRADPPVSNILLVLLDRFPAPTVPTGHPPRKV